jgi:hypothetical protein
MMDLGSGCGLYLPARANLAGRVVAQEVIARFIIFAQLPRLFFAHLPERRALEGFLRVGGEFTLGALTAQKPTPLHGGAGAARKARAFHGRAPIG